MDSSGNIHQLTAESLAANPALVLIPDDELAAVRAMSKTKRKKWYREHIRLHPAAPIPGETEADQRARKNERKRKRRAQK